MKSLSEMLRLGRQIRAIGFDDAPFEKEAGSPVNISGVVCSATRFEGLLWGEATRDGLDATDTISGMLLNSKFYEQVHVVLTDGITFGGLNFIDLPLLAERLDRPCVAVMRRPPDLDAIRAILPRLPDSEERLRRLDRAGPIHELGGFVFQVVGDEAPVAAEVLGLLTDNGLVPEPLRIAHLIGSAIMSGESGRRA
jgi:endonuclease V-like protein UPF0215 family